MSSTPGPPPIPHEAQVNQKRGQAIMVWAVGAFCIYGWDWIICLPQEYQRIWRKKITPITVLYLANRYFGFLQFSFVMSLVANAWGPAACKHTFYWEPVGALISTILSQMILGSRVYALYAQSWVIGSMLSVILVVEVGIGGYSISTTSAPPPSSGPPGTSPPCGAVMGPQGWLIAFWALPLFYDTFTFLLTALKTYDFWRKEVDTPLVAVIWRDGVLYFFSIFSMNFANVLIFLTAPKSLRAINLTPTLILTVLMSCRLVLNLRNTHAKAASPNSSGLTPNSSTKNKPNPIRHNRGISYDKTIAPKSEWIDVVSDKLEAWPHPDPDGVGEHPNRMV